MKFTQNDFNEIPLLARVVKRIDTIDSTNVNSILDDIYKKQPFLLSVLLGYNLDITPIELEELMKVYFLIWEYFKDNQNVQNRKVTEQLFEKIHNRNIGMLRYAEGDSTDQSAILYSSDLQNLRSKALLTAILLRFNNRPDLVSMDMKTKGMILIGIKTFIECFEIV